MKKILIKGILVITLIITPSIITVEVFAYELLKAPSVAIVVQNEKSLPTVDDISNTIASIDNNNRVIQRLLKEKTNTINKIYNLMDSNAKSKTCLSEQQITNFQQFTSIFQSELRSLQDSLAKIQDADYNTITSEIIRLEPDKSAIYSDLKDVLKYQDSAINSLSAIIDAASNALSFL